MQFEHEINRGKEFIHQLETFLSSPELLQWDKERGKLKSRIIVLEEAIKSSEENKFEAVNRLQLKLARHAQNSGEVLKLLQRCLPYLKELDNLEYGNEKDLNEIIEGINELK